ncbi:MAG: Ldh family oxidoreductase [Planctomycetota bacterium]
MTRILLTTTSYQDTPGYHHDLLEAQGWEVVRKRGPLSEYEMLELAGDFDGFICGDDAITAAVIDKSLPRLKWISKYGIGIDKIDKQYATDQGLPIGFCPGVNHTTVAEHTFGLILGLTKKIFEVGQETRQGNWKRLTGNEILGKRLGIIGMGRIGKAVIERAVAFGMECCAFDVSWDEAFADQHGVERCQSIDQLLYESDVVSLHCFLDASTENLINASSLAKMKDGAIIINCARGEVVNTSDVAAALNAGKLGGYGADVLEVEPPPADHVLFSTPNTIITSHIGSRTYESVVRQATMATKNAIAFVAGEPPLAQANKLAEPVDPEVTESKTSNPAVSGDAMFIVDPAEHDKLVSAAYLSRGYSESEAAAATKFCRMASHYGIRTHNAIKALHLDHLFGSAVGGCVPGAEIEKRPCRFEGSEIWDAKLKLGQSVAFDAIERCIELADKFGVGQVSVDNTFHYLWGGGYVMDAALRGYIAYTNCTSTLAEVVPFGGKFPTLGTNPHSWAFPTQDAVGYPVVIDWATSTVAMGRVQQYKREGKKLPPGAAVDAKGEPTDDPNLAVSLLPFGAHKGYGLSLINELVAALIGGSLPTLRGREVKQDDKSSTNFYFQVIHPEALDAGLFACGRDQQTNIKAVLEDILGHGNESCLLPGQIEANAARETEAAGGLLFSLAEIESFNEIAHECGMPPWDVNALPNMAS